MKAERLRATGMGKGPGRLRRTINTQTKAKSPDAANVQGFFISVVPDYERTCMNFTALLAIIKSPDKETIMELAKSKWIKFSVGAAILMLSSQGFIKALAVALKG